MLEGINLDEVKQYNASLKQYRDKAASLKAEIEYTNKTLDEMCTELSKELNMEVTRDNVEQIYNSQVEKINSILQSGNAVLAKIKAEEQTLMQQAQPTQQAQQTQQMQAQPAPQVQQMQTQPVQQTQQMQTPQVNMAQPVQPVQASQTQYQDMNNPVLGASNSEINIQSIQSEPKKLPPLFSV